jgi:hypothetical protein
LGILADIAEIARPTSGGGRVVRALRTAETTADATKAMSAAMRMSPMAAEIDGPARSSPGQS